MPNGQLARDNLWKKAKTQTYKTHQKNIKAINGIPKSKKFFLSINSFLKQKDWKLFVAKKNNLSIAALLLFYFNETVEYYTPAILEEYRNGKWMVVRKLDKETCAKIILLTQEQKEL